MRLLFEIPLLYDRKLIKYEKEDISIDEKYMTMRMGGEWNMENAVPAAVTGDGQDADELFRSLG